MRIQLQLTIIALLAVIFLHQCQQAKPGNQIDAKFSKDKILRIIEEDTITLSWDKPSDTSHSVKKYKLLYRSHSSGTWKLLRDSIGAIDTPWVNIYRSDVGANDSLLDFAVRAMFQGGDSSDLVISTDSMSYPRGGWFVKW